MNAGIHHVMKLTWITLASTLLCAQVAIGADAPAATSAAAPSAVSKDTREKMAALHEKMAACLRSDKPIAECRNEMMKSCRESIGAQACPMAGFGGGMGAGMGPGRQGRADFAG